MPFTTCQLTRFHCAGSAAVWRDAPIDGSMPRPSSGLGSVTKPISPCSVSILLAALDDKMQLARAFSLPTRRQSAWNISRLSVVAPPLALSARSAGPHLLLVVLVNVRRETGGAQLRVAREPAVEPVDAERREGRRTLAARDDPVRQVLTDGR